MSSSANSLRTIFYALGANIGIFAIKLVAAIFTSSGAMMAEAVHSLADCGNQGLLLLGIKRAKRPPTPDYPLGYGKEIYFWSFLVALMLFSVGGAFSVVEGIKHLRSPEPINNPWVALGVLGISVVLEAFSLRGAMIEIRKISHGKSFFRWFRETRQSELMVVAGEDIAALAGLALAFVAVVLTVLTGNPLWDACGSIAVGLLLMIVAVIVMREVKAMVTGESAAPELHAAIEAHIAAHPEIDHVMNLISMQWGHQIMIAVQAEMRPQTSDIALVDAINAIEADIQSRWPQVVWCFFEPDRKKPPAAVTETELSSYP